MYDAIKQFVSSDNFNAGNVSSLASAANMAMAMITARILPQSPGDWNTLLQIAAAADELRFTYPLTLMAAIVHETSANGAVLPRTALMLLTGQLPPSDALVELSTADGHLRSFIYSRMAIRAYEGGDNETCRKLAEAWESIPRRNDGRCDYDPEAQRLLLRACATNDPVVRLQLCDYVADLGGELRSRYCLWIHRLWREQLTPVVCMQCSAQAALRDYLKKCKEAVER